MDGLVRGINKVEGICMAEANINESLVQIRSYPPTNVANTEYSDGGIPGRTSDMCILLQSIEAGLGNGIAVKLSMVSIRASHSHGDDFT